MAYSAQLKSLLRNGSKVGYVIEERMGSGKLIRLKQYSIHAFATRQACTQAVRYGLVIFDGGRYWLNADGYKAARALPVIVPSKGSGRLPDHTICKDCGHTIFPANKVKHSKLDEIDDTELRVFVCWFCGEITRGYGMDKHVK